MSMQSATTLITVVSSFVACNFAVPSDRLVIVCQRFHNL